MRIIVLGWCNITINTPKQPVPYQVSSFQKSVRYVVSCEPLTADQREGYREAGG